MKRFILLAIATMILSSCGLFKVTTYSTSLVSVESPANAKEKYGETKIVTTSENDISKYTYEDDFISIVWYISRKQLNFVLTNKSGFSIKLPWDEMAYVNERGQSMRVIHQGVKLIDRNSSQAPTVVAKNASLDDLLIPSDNIYYVSGKYGGWEEKNLFPSYSSQEEANNSPALGKTVRVVFPIIIQDVTNEYIFEFSVDSVSVK